MPMLVTRLITSYIAVLQPLILSTAMSNSYNTSIRLVSDL